MGYRGCTVGAVRENEGRADASPPTRRVVQVLRALASHPIHPRTLTQLVADTGMSKATAHSILGTLESAAMVTRDPTSKGYLLGPTAIALGRAAEQSIPGGHATKLAAAELSNATGMPVTTAACRDGGLVVIDVADPSRSGTELPVRVGQRIPATPPFGIVFATWPPADPRSGAKKNDVTVNDSALYGDLVLEVRARGYTVQRVSETGLHLSLTIGDLPEATRYSDDEVIVKVLQSLDNHDYTEAELRSGAMLDVGLISAPVLSEGGEALLSVSLWPRQRLSHAQIGSLAEQLLAATGHSSRRIAGTLENTLADEPRPMS